MEYLESIGNILLTFVEQVSFFYVIFRKGFRKLHRREIIGIIICCVLLLVGACLGWGFLESLTPIPPHLILIFIILFNIFEVSVKEMIGLSLAQWLILCVQEMAMYVTLQDIGMSRSMLDYTIMISISFVLWAYYYVLGRKLNSHLFRLPIKMWYLLDCIMLILTLMLTFFSYTITEELPVGKMNNIGRVLVILGGNLICILLFVTIYCFNSMQMFQLQKEFVEQQNDQQKEYFLQLLEKEEQTKQFRHDIIDHLLELKNYCDKQDYISLKTYLTDTLGDARVK